jgi:hypothetical protein
MSTLNQSADWSDMRMDRRQRTSTGRVKLRWTGHKVGTLLPPGTYDAAPFPFPWRGRGRSSASRKPAKVMQHMPKGYVGIRSRTVGSTSGHTVRDWKERVGVVRGIECARPSTRRTQGLNLVCQNPLRPKVNRSRRPEHPIRPRTTEKTGMEKTGMEKTGKEKSRKDRKERDCVVL